MTRCCVYYYVVAAKIFPMFNVKKKWLEKKNHNRIVQNVTYLVNVWHQ